MPRQSVGLDLILVSWVQIFLLSLDPLPCTESRFMFVYFVGRVVCFVLWERTHSHTKSFISAVEIPAGEEFHPLNCQFLLIGLILAQGIWYFAEWLCILEGSSHTEMWRSDSDRTLASSSTPPLPTMWPSFSRGIPALVTGQIGSLLCKTGPYYRARGQSQVSQLPPCPLRCCLHPADNPPWPIFSLSLSLSLLLPGPVIVGFIQTISQHICFRIQDRSLCMT